MVFVIVVTFVVVFFSVAEMLSRCASRTVI
jgi:hypothetical protein